MLIIYVKDDTRRFPNNTSLVFIVISEYYTFIVVFVFNISAHFREQIIKQNYL